MFHIYLFFWLRQVLVAACRILSFSIWAFSCSMWDLFPWSGIEPGPLHWESGPPGKLGWLSCLPWSQNHQVRIKWKVWPQKDNELVGGRAGEWQGGIRPVLRVAVSYQFATLLCQSALGTTLVWAHQQGTHRDHAPTGIIFSWPNLTLVKRQCKSQLDIWGLARMGKVSIIQYFIAILSSYSRVKREPPYQCWLLSYHGLKCHLPASGLLQGTFLVRVTVFSSLINVLLISWMLGEWAYVLILFLPYYL